jgi:hypothetical protein
MSCHSVEENVFHLTRFDDSAFTSPHVLPWCPISSHAIFFRVVLSRPLLHAPCGFQSIACLSMESSDFLSVWPIHLHFRLLIWVWTGSSPASYNSSSVLIFSGQWIFRIFLRHLLMKIWSFLLITIFDFRVSAPYKRTACILLLKIFHFFFLEMSEFFHTGYNCSKVESAFPILLLTSSRASPSLIMLPR